MWKRETFVMKALNLICWYRVVKYTHSIVIILFLVDNSVFLLRIKGNLKKTFNIHCIGLFDCSKIVCQNVSWPASFFGWKICSAIHHRQIQVETSIISRHFHVCSNWKSSTNQFISTERDIFDFCIS